MKDNIYILTLLSPPHQDEGKFLGSGEEVSTCLSSSLSSKRTEHFEVRIPSCTLGFKISHFLTKVKEFQSIRVYLS